MIVKEIMSSDVLAVRADAALPEAIDLLEHSDEGVLAVYEENNLIGTLSEHDIAAWIAPPGRDVNGAKVRDVVHREAPLAREDQDVREAARLMKEQHTSSLVVMRDGQPIGTVTLADLATRIDLESSAPPAATSNASADGRREPQMQPQGMVAERLMTAAPPARIFLQPIAAPSVLGLFGFSAATFMVGAYYAGWFGTTTTPLYLAPFVAVFGGLAQFFAGMWAYRARDGMATAIHGTWGSFWLSYGILYTLVAGGSLTLGAVNPAFGWWFIPLAAVTLAMAIAASGRNAAFSAMLLILTVASAIAAIGLLVPSANWLKGGGYVFMVSALVAWYTATALLLEETFRRVILPLGHLHADANIPGRRYTRPVEWQYGEPGVRAGQ